MGLERSQIGRNGRCTSPSTNRTFCQTSGHSGVLLVESPPAFRSHLALHGRRTARPRSVSEERRTCPGTIALAASAGDARGAESWGSAVDLASISPARPVEPVAHAADDGRGRSHPLRTRRTRPSLPRSCMRTGPAAHHLAQGVVEPWPLGREQGGPSPSPSRPARSASRCCERPRGS